MRALLGLVALLMLAMPAQAQTCDLSTDAPCTIAVDTDSDGVYYGNPAVAQYNVTQGDAHVIEVWNWFDEAHEMSLEGYDLEFTAASFDEGPITRSETIVFDQAGAFLLRDLDSGQAATIVVAEADVIDLESETEASTPAQDAPGPAFTFLVAGLLLMAAKRR